MTANATCQACGEQLRPGSAFCEWCGAKVTSQPEAPVADEFSRAETEVVPAVEPAIAQVEASVEPAAPAAEASAEPEGQALGSNYLVFEVLGRGGMGEVRRGRSRSDGREVAIKLLRPELAEDQSLVGRFLEERRILMSLDNANLVRVHDLVAEGSTLAIVMDLVTGPDLRTELTRRGTFAPADAAALTIGVLNGLAAVHAGGVVHRDLKPENVLLQPVHANALPLPRLTDFGISKFIQTSATARRTTLIGTPEYMAPELADDAEPSRAADLYAIGVMLYELLTGVTPFAGGNAMAVMNRQMNAAPGRPAGVPDLLWDLIARLLAKAPAARPDDAGAVAAELGRILPAVSGLAALPVLTEPPAPAAVTASVTQAVSAPPSVPETGLPSVPEQSSKRRGRGRFVAAGVVAAVLLGGGGAGAAVFLNSGNKTLPAVAAGASSSATPPATSSPTVSETPTDTPTPSESPTPTDTPSPSVSATPGVMPALTGTDLADATSQLEALGVTVTSVDALDEKKADGTVLKQSPAAGQPVGATATLTVARQPVLQYLADEQSVASGGDSRAETVTVNGKDYTRSIELYTDCYPGTAYLEYDLGRHFRKLRAVVGPRDDAPSDSQVLVEIFNDGRKVWSKKMTLGKPAALDLDVTKTLRLRLQVTMLNRDTCGDTWTAFGDAVLLGVQGEVPESAPSGS